MRIIIGVTGASGTIYGWRLLEKLHLLVSVETHLIVSRSAERTAFLELGKTLADFKKLADIGTPWRISARGSPAAPSLRTQ